MIYQRALLLCPGRLARHLGLCGLVTVVVPGRKLCTYLQRQSSTGETTSLWCLLQIYDDITAAVQASLDKQHGKVAETEGALAAEGAATGDKVRCCLPIWGLYALCFVI